MNKVFIGKGKLAGKGVFAARDLKKGEIIIKYHLKPLTRKEFECLPKKEKLFTHQHWGKTHLYSSPERYVNHSRTPNTRQDLKKKCDIAKRNIKKSEEITTDAAKDDTS
ncbi:SET domain-containing protein [Candidatus Woesearchaeota archaeon]|nr:SET domain-containing protein [Candidatus Woesearchaeota archaeon]